MNRDYTRLLEQGYTPAEIDEMIADEEHEKRRKRKEKDDE